VLRSNLPAPDDLIFDQAGRLFFSDIKTGTVSAIGADGSAVTIASGLSAPEGMVFTTDGRLLVAEQGRNRVVTVDVASHTITPWRLFPNRTGRDGIDGIGPVLLNGDIIVPDSPNGLVWRVSPDGKTATRIASAMTRPVDAAVDARGRIFVADEGGALWVLDAGQRRFSTLLTPDDVLVSRDGHLFVNTLGDNAIHEIDSLGHTVSVLRGIRSPQGIAVDNADNLYYTEFDAGRIERVVRTFVLDKATVTPTGRGGFVICPSVRRAPGFTESLTLTPESNASTGIVQLRQPGRESSGALEVRSAEHAVTFGIGTGLLQLTQTVPLPSAP
jgi:sugar lactone lactonase YvrE